MGQDIGRVGNANSKTIALQHDKEGKLRHDAIARIGHDKDKVSFVGSFKVYLLPLDYPHFNCQHQAALY
jgi:hypothetical protein